MSTDLLVKLTMSMGHRSALSIWNYAALSGASPVVWFLASTDQLVTLRMIVVSENG